MQINAEQLTISYGMSTHQNKRPYQEDRFTHAVINQGHFFGIYDGHGGDKVSEYLQTHLHKEVLAKTKGEAFKYMFLEAEKYALKNCTDGSTALVAWIGDAHILHCAWVGDTRAVLEKNGAVDFQTRDHKPDDAQELARIKSLGGTIEKYGVWRVGGLAISRSIGDANIKKKFAGQVIADPDYAGVQLDEDNHFLIMASDGLWDVMSSEKAVEMVTQKFAQGETVNNIAQSLQKEAIAQGSADNITVCVIKFDWSGNKKAIFYETSVVTTTPYSLMVQFFDWLQGARQSDKEYQSYRNRKKAYRLPPEIE